MLGCILGEYKECEGKWPEAKDVEEASEQHY